MMRQKITNLSFEDSLQTGSTDCMGARQEFGRMRSRIVTRETRATGEEAVGEILHIYHHRFDQTRRHLKGKTIKDKGEFRRLSTIS